MDQRIEVNGKTIQLKISPYNARLSIGNYKRKILEALNKIGIEKQYIDIIFGGGTGYHQKAWAETTWMVNGEEHKYRCDSQSRDVDNVAAIAQVIEQDSKSIRRGLKTFGQVMNQFKLEYNPDGPRIRSPREIIGIPGDMKDLDYITFKYKKRAKHIHPDAEGSTEEMQELNQAYEDIKKELA